MDWSRAKTIFIISFILLDLFLAAQINQMIEQKSNYLKTDELSEEQIHELLEVHEIKIATSIPDRSTQIPALQTTISPIFDWDYDEKWMYHKVFQPPIPIKDQATLEKYLKEKIPVFHEYTYSKEYSDGERFTYLQQAEQHPIFDGRMVCHLKNKQLTKIQVLNFQIREKIHVDFIPFNRALYNLITRENLPKGAKISDIQLGYRSLYYPSPNEVILVPVWRFTVNNKHHYIYATTNNLKDRTAWDNTK